MTIQLLSCGCCLLNNSLSCTQCREGHTPETNPPPGFSEGKTNAEHAPRRPRYQPTKAGPLPELERARRQRWNATTGELEEVEHDDG